VAYSAFFLGCRDTYLPVPLAFSFLFHDNSCRGLNLDLSLKTEWMKTKWQYDACRYPHTTSFVLGLLFPEVNSVSRSWVVRFVLTLAFFDSMHANYWSHAPSWIFSKKLQVYCVSLLHGYSCISSLELFISTYRTDSRNFSLSNIGTICLHVLKSFTNLLWICQSQAPPLFNASNTLVPFQVI